ncbi:MAG: S4 domain-containing protein, partial [Bacteroidota bacterium]
MAKTPRYLQLSKARNAGPVPRIPIEWVEGRPMRLNKYLAHSGLANRRTCENYIKGGQIEVNGQQVKNPGFLVSRGDEVSRWKKPLTVQPGLAYALANRAAGIAETELGKLLRHPDLPGLEWKSVFPRPQWVSGLSLLTNDEAMVAKLSSKAHQLKANLLIPEQMNTSVISLAELENLPVLDPSKPQEDLISLMSFDKRDLPRGFYRFLRP